MEDHPINLRDPKLMEKPDLLPHMRLLHHDEELLELTFEILLWGAKAGFQNSIGDRNKMEQFLQLVIAHFYKLDFTKISQRSKSLKTISDEEITLASNPEAFEKAKKREGFTYCRYNQSPDQAPEVPLQTT